MEYEPDVIAIVETLYNESDARLFELFRRMLEWEITYGTAPED